MNYICTHTDFTLPNNLTGDYTILSTKQPLENKYPFPIIYPDNQYKELQYNYAEGYMIYDIYKNANYNNTDNWVSINHYRRYIDYQPNTITLPTPIRTNMHAQYKACHNINHLLEVEQIIDELFPNYSMDYKNINILYPCNMFQLPLKDFNAYTEFQFKVLDEFNKRNNLYNRTDVENFVLNTKQGYTRLIDLNYQSRLQGFLMERIGTIFFINYLKGNTNTKFNPIKLTSKKIVF